MSEEALQESLRRELERLETVDSKLAMLALGELAEGADIVALVAQLRKDKPFLFKVQTRAPLAMGVIPDALAPSKREVEELAARAREGSDRGAMLRFMRARRGQ
jgi:hypothetical protein